MTDEPEIQNKIKISDLFLLFELMVISTVLVLLPIFYQTFFLQPFYLQNSMIISFFLGLFGYIILIIDLISRFVVIIIEKAPPILLNGLKKIIDAYKKHDTLYGYIFLLIMATILVIAIYSAAGIAPALAIIGSLIVTFILKPLYDKISKNPKKIP